MKRTLENCSLIQLMIRHWQGRPEQRNGKCLGYGMGYDDDEPCDICKKCKLCESYEDGDGEC